MTTETFSAYSLRTIAVTEHQWIAMSATSMGGNDIRSVEDARIENLKALHERLAERPPVSLGLGTTWRVPRDNMEVVIHDTIVKQDLVSGEALEERELERYTILYRLMNLEKD